MRVFVTGTGRCGTSTFTKACQKLTNYTASHESLVGEDSIGLWQYPDNHIEVAAQLAIAIPILLDKYPGSKWVHLIRDEKDCIESLSKEVWFSMQIFGFQWFLSRIPSDSKKLAEAFYKTVNANIAALIPKDSLTIKISRDSYKPTAMREQWVELFQFINAKGDFEASLAEWQKIYNPAGNRGKDSYIQL